MLSSRSFLFFFQAEDGIRDHCVTGVQTCALPIFPTNALYTSGVIGQPPAPALFFSWCEAVLPFIEQDNLVKQLDLTQREYRSEERRVGKSVDLGGGSIIKKKSKKTRIEK